MKILCLTSAVISASQPNTAVSKAYPPPLPAAIFGMLVVYCLKNVDIAGGSHGLPELISLAVLTALHLWRKNMLLSIAAGTVCYMLLVQFVFV